MTQRTAAHNNASYFMAGYGRKMNILAPNINQCGQTNLSSEIRHKVYAAR